MTSIHAKFFLLSCLLFCATSLIAQEPKSDDSKPEKEVSADTGDAPEGAKATEENEDNTAGPLSGHSYHGAAFNEGPRQQAYLIPGMANVDFPVTTQSELAQKFFNQGISALHGFWNLEAERAFRQVHKLDPKCAMAFWGMAMANKSNTKRSKVFMEEATKLTEGITDAERRFIDSLSAYLKADPAKKKERADAYIKKLEQLCIDYPDHLEAKAFLAIMMYSNRSQSGGTASYVALDAIIGQILEQNPMHPSHHYRIHLWDYKKPTLALNSAILCGQSTPGIAHMWHMPGHIFSRVKRYDDAVWQQEASARVDHSHMMRDRVLPDQIHNYAHNNEWCTRNLLNIGRVEDAIALAQNLTTLPRHPKYNTLARRGSSSYYGRARLFTTLYMYERWQDMITLANTAVLEPTSIEAEQVKRLKYVGIAHAMLGQTTQTDAFKKELQTLLNHNSSEQDKAGETAKTKAEAEQAKDTKKKEADKNKAITKATTDARRAWDKKVRDCEQAIAALNGYTHLKNGEHEKALELLRKAGSIDRMTIAKCQQASGDTDGAIKAAAAHVKSHTKEVQPLALQVEILHTAGKAKEAQTAFKELQAISSSIDMQSPVFARITAIAADLGCDGQWKQELKVRDDIGNRPDLDTLGPFRWQPSPAPEFMLRDHRNRKFSSVKEFNGKPTIVVFYLGHGCLACAEQLQKVIDNYGKFTAAGFDVLAISSDDDENLKQSIKHFDGKLPFTIVNDPKLEIFKEYRVHDDFEEQPLHGTFIVDGDGFVRWQDINYEPFMDTDFLLKEATRLLDIK